MEKRYFIPAKATDLKPECLPYMGQVVTVAHWFPRVAAPEVTDRVGFVREFMLDVPEHELIPL